MPTELVSLLRATRLSLGLKLGHLAKLLGYRNLNGGARRLELLELSGQEKAEFADRAVAVLGIDEAIVSEARVRDEASRRETSQPGSRSPFRCNS